MVWMGIDLGNARVGIAFSDPEMSMAMPYGNLAAHGDYFSTLNDAAQLAQTHDATCIVVGYPLLLSGDEGRSAKKARRWAMQLAHRLNAVFIGADGSVASVQASAPDGDSSHIVVKLQDERLTTVIAHRDLTDAGREMRQHRSAVDQQSAVLILQSALAKRSAETVRQQDARTDASGADISEVSDNCEKNTDCSAENVDNGDSYEEFIRQGIDARFLDKLLGHSVAD